MMDVGRETRSKILADLAKRQLHDALDQSTLAALSAHALLQVDGRGAKGVEEGATAHLERLSRSLDTPKVAYGSLQKLWSTQGALLAPSAAEYGTHVPSPPTSSCAGA